MSFLRDGEEIVELPIDEYQKMVDVARLAYEVVLRTDRKSDPPIGALQSALAHCGVNWKEEKQRAWREAYYKPRKWDPR